MIEVGERTPKRPRTRGKETHPSAQGRGRATSSRPGLSLCQARRLHTPPVEMSPTVMCPQKVSRPHSAREQRGLAPAPRRLPLLPGGTPRSGDHGHAPATVTDTVSAQMPCAWHRAPRFSRVLYELPASLPATSVPKWADVTPATQTSNTPERTALGGDPPLRLAARAVPKSHTPGDVTAETGFLTVVEAGGRRSRRC